MRVVKILILFFVCVFVLSQIGCIAPVGVNTRPMDSVTEIGNRVHYTYALLSPVYNSVVDVFTPDYSEFYDLDLFERIVEYGNSNDYPDLILPERYQIFSIGLASIFLGTSAQWFDNLADFYNCALSMFDDGLLTPEEWATVKDWYDYLIAYAWVGPLTNVFY